MGSNGKATRDQVITQQARRLEVPVGSDREVGEAASDIRTKVKAANSIWSSGQYHCQGRVAKAGRGNPRDSRQLVR